MSIENLIFSLCQFYSVGNAHHHTSFGQSLTPVASSSTAINLSVKCSIEASNGAASTVADSSSELSAVSDQQPALKFFLFSFLDFNVFYFLGNWSTIGPFWRVKESQR